MNFEDFKKSNSKSFLKLNPALGGMAAYVNQSQSGRALVKNLPARQKSEGGVAVRVIFVGFAKTKMDSDNFVRGCKPLRDAVAESLGLDDGSEHIEWEYGQVKTDGLAGVAARIEVST